MKTYYWHGKNQQQETLHGMIKANTPLLAKITLIKQGITLKTVHRYRPIMPRIAAKDYQQFFYQFSMLLQSGIPCMHSLDLLVHHQQKRSMQILVRSIKHALSMGSTLSDALAEHPSYCHVLDIQLIKVGEAVGKLPLMLSEIAAYRAGVYAIKRQIKQALLYPTLLLCVSIGVVGILLTTVVPSFQQLFSSMHATLPPATQFMIRLAQSLEKYGLSICLYSIGVVVCSYFAYCTVSSFKRALHGAILRLPLLHRLIKTTLLLRFTKTLMLLSNAHLPLHHALPLISQTLGNFCYQEAVLAVCKQVESGQLLHQAMEKYARLFPTAMIQTIQLAETCGSMVPILEQLSLYYEQEIKITLENLRTVLEPVMICVLSGVIGGLIVTMYLPIFQLGSIF